MGKEMSLGYQLLHYFKERIKFIIVLAVMILIFTVTILLSQLPLAAVAYAALLSACFCLIAAVLDFAHYCKRQKNLLRLCDCIGQSIEGLPEAKSQTEKNYQALIVRLLEEKEKIQTEQRKINDDMLDYYSLWVHQIKTPIAALRLLIQSEEKSEKHLLSELNKIEQYVQMALYYMRLENDSRDYVFAEYKLGDILQKTIKQHRAQFIGKGISLEYNPINEKVISDEKWLVFALGQIISNAIKYTENGKISISMESPGFLVIADTGIGIQETDLPRIFEKGYTGYNGRLEQRSTGLGLYLCKRVLDNLSHRIQIESKPYGGTVVTIAFSADRIWPE